MIQPHEIIDGAMFEYNCGEIETPQWEITTLDWEDIRTCKLTNEYFNQLHRPIPLTEKILVEWCGAEERYKEWFNLGILTLGYITRDDIFQMEILIPTFNKTGMSPYNSKIIDIPYLHIFQRLILALTNQPLKIEMK